MNRELKDPTGVGKIHKGDMYDELKFHKFGWLSNDMLLFAGSK